MGDRYLDFVVRDIETQDYISDEITGVAVSVPESFLSKAEIIMGALLATGMHHAVMREGSGVNVEFQSPTGAPDFFDVSDRVEISVSAAGDIQGVANWVPSNTDVRFGVGNIQDLRDRFAQDHVQGASKPKMGM